MKLLKDLINVNSDIKVAYLSEDSNDIKDNTMFFALKGANFDGHKAIDDVIAKGANVIVFTDDIKNFQDGVYYYKVTDIEETKASIATKFFDQPSHKMKVVGVTGTNGKTTITWLLHKILEKIKKSAYIGTIGIVYNNELYTNNHFTTPKAIQLNALLADLVSHGIDYVNLEVSSHSLASKRSHLIDVDYGVMTNLSSDHENYHGSMENYKKAKQILFEDLRSDAYAILNHDDDTFAEYASASKAKVISYGIENKSDVQAYNIVLNKNSSEFDLKIFNDEYHIKTNLIAKFNIYNLMPVLTILYLEGINLNSILVLLEKLELPSGRMEMIKLGQDFEVIVDYAHTTDGYIKVLDYAKEICKGRIIALLGSVGGDRNHEKRPVIGELMSQQVDLLILTKDNPRDESVFKINSEIKAGITNDVQVVEYEDRAEAVSYAIKNAKKDDVILLLGKGHEKNDVVDGIDVDYEGDLDLAIRLIEERLVDENK
jgi:UDP-N-acetylmuramoyl-L-alanyl-D-glutamate--2,6-diaminopimelate ligase